MKRLYLTNTVRPLVLLTLLLCTLLPTVQPVQAGDYTVINTNDSGPGSLRRAITDANGNAGPDSINFNIPSSDPGYSNLAKVWIIRPATPLPNLSGVGGVSVDGNTQTVNRGDTNKYGPEVQLDGLNLAPAKWMFSVESNDNFIKGLAITRAGGVGIRIRSNASKNTISGNHIGIDPTGTSTMGNGIGIELYAGASINTISGNLISGNLHDGIKIYGAGTTLNDVKDNIIGLDGTGVAPMPNGGHGVSLSSGATMNFIGGDEQDRNIISGNSMSGVYIHGAGTDSNYVWGNYVGTGLDGDSAVGNAHIGVVITDGAKDSLIQSNVISGNKQHGVFLYGSGTENNIVRLNIIGADEQVTKLIPNGQHNVAVYNGPTGNWVGSISPPWGNTIVGAGWSGIVLHKANQNSVLHNAIGTNESGTAANLGNTYYGVHVEGMQNTIGISNTIAYNKADGIRVDGKTTPAQSNLITRNSIYANGGLGIELWSNGNNELNAPLITKATCQLIEGSVCSGCDVEFFSDAADEGKLYEGTTSANAILPAFSWSGTAVGPMVTATATDSQGNTSEFSIPIALSCNPPTAAVSVQPNSGPPGTSFRFDASVSSDLEDPTSALQVRWDWQDNGSYDTPWRSSKIINHSFNTPGDHFVRVQVRDTDSQTDSTDQLVRVILTVQEHPLFIPMMVNRDP